MSVRKLDPEKLKQSLEAHMAEDQATGRVGGAGLCVMQEGREVYKSYFGKKSYVTGEDMSHGDDVIFRLASMTKPVTAVAALIQVGRGKLELDAPISALLPEFSEMRLGTVMVGQVLLRMGPARTPITLRMLLNHTSGLGCGALEVCAVQDAKMTAEDRQDLAHAVKFFSQTALSFEPATFESYSTTAGFDVAARMVELTSGMPFDRFVKENIFDPCGMTDTTFAPTDEQWRRMVTMHNCVDGHSEDAATVPGCVFENFPVTWSCAGAGLAATLPDYVRFAEMLCRGGVAQNGTRILPAELVKAMGTPTVPTSIMPDPQRWGIGVRVISGAYHMPVNCFGWSGAYGSHFWVDPDNRISAVYMKNSRYDGGAGSRTSVVFEKDVYEALE